MYTKEELLNGLKTESFGKKVYIYDTIDSTNNCAKMLAGYGAKEGTVVIADYQSAGRGRQGRNWQSEPGKNLLFSIVLKPKLEVNQVGLLTYFIAVGTAIAVEEITSLPCECKWPNDLLMNGKKFCGILIESSFQNFSLDYAVAGVGINVNQKVFNHEIVKKATSLLIETNREFEIKNTFQKIMETLEMLNEDVKNNKFDRILNEWKKRTKLFGMEITISDNGTLFKGTAVDITYDGGLIISTDNKQSIHYSGDVIKIEQ